MVWSNAFFVVLFALALPDPAVLECSLASGGPFFGCGRKHNPQKELYHLPPLASLPFIQLLPEEFKKQSPQVCVPLDSVSLVVRMPISVQAGGIEHCLCRLPLSFR